MTMEAHASGRLSLAKANGAPRCGAKTRTTGQLCKHLARKESGRCRLHFRPFDRTQVRRGADALTKGEDDETWMVWSGGYGGTQGATGPLASAQGRGKKRWRIVSGDPSLMAWARACVPASIRVAI